MTVTEKINSVLRSMKAEAGVAIPIEIEIAVRSAFLVGFKYSSERLGKCNTDSDIEAIKRELNDEKEYAVKLCSKLENQHDNKQN